MPLEPVLGSKEASNSKPFPANKPSKDSPLLQHILNHMDGSREKTTRSLRRSKEDMDSENILPAQFRGQLYSLFSQIEREFEQLYACNLSLQEKVDALTEKIGAEGGATEKTQLLESQDSTDFGAKNKKSQLSQKIKTTYKVSTSKLVSSFRTPNPVYSLVRQFRGHRDGVWEVSVSRSQGLQVIATASADHRSRIFSIETGSCLLQYMGHKGSVNSVRFHPTQDLALTASGDGTAHIWRALVSHDALKSHSSGEDEIDSSEREDTADDVADYSHESSVVRNPQLEFSQHSEVVTAADWMCSGSQILTASWDRTSVLADAESGQVISILSGHDQELTDVHAHPNQKLVLTSSKDTTFRLWDFQSPAMVVNVFQGHTQQVTTAVFAGSDKVVSGSDDRTVKVWDMRNMRSPIAAIRTDSEVNRLSVSQAQGIIAIPLDNRNIRLYDINGARIGRLPRNSRQGHTRMVCSVAWLDNNPMSNLFSCGFDRQVLGWMVNLQGKE